MLCYSAHHHCDKIPGTIIFKGEKIYFGSQFLRFQSMVGLVALSLVMKQNLMTVGVCAEKPSHFMGEREEEKERDRQRWNIPISQYPLQGHAFSDLTSSH
jgi:hypothetical protein